MIISHKHRFIFIKTTKVAGTSLEIALAKYCGKNDIITPLQKEDEKLRKKLGYWSAQNFEKPIYKYTIGDIIDKAFVKNPVIFYPHINASEIQKRVDPDLWAQYLKFTVVRNPFDYVVSRYLWNKSQGRTDATFKDFLLGNPQTLVINRNIYMINGKSAVDLYVRYENFEEDLKVLSNKLGLEENVFDIMKNIKAKTNKKRRTKKTKEYFHNFQDGVDLINILCRYEIEKFGYRLE